MTQRPANANGLRINRAVEKFFEHE